MIKSYYENERIQDLHCFGRPFTFPSSLRNTEAHGNIARWVEDYNRDRPHREVQHGTPHEAFLAFAGVLKNETLTV